MSYKLLSKKDWDAILTALNMVAAGEWDDNSYGERPDFEAVIAKIKRRASHGL
jgi:hypothetical protein